MGRGDREFFLILIVSVLFYSLLALLANFVPTVEIEVPLFQRHAPRTARLILKAPKPLEVVPPVAKQEVASPKRERRTSLPPKAEPVKALPSPPVEVKPVDPQVVEQQNREAAMKSGLLKLLARRSSSEDKGLEEVFSHVEELSPTPAPMAPEERPLRLKREGSGGIDEMVVGLKPGIEEHQLKGRLTTVVENPFQIKGSASGMRLRSVDSIQRVVRVHQSGMTFLYNKALQETPNLKGQITLEFTILAGGELTGVRIVSSTLHNGDFEEALRQHIHAWRFDPITDGEVTSIYPIRFTPA
jgi:TonB family protein